MKLCFQKQESTCGKHIFSLVLRAVNIYILVFDNFKNQRYCVLFYEIMGPPFWLFFLDATFSDVQFSTLGRFCVNDYNAKIKTRIACNNFFSGRYGIRSQVTKAIFEFHYLFQSLRSPAYPITKLNIILRAVRQE